MSRAHAGGRGGHGPSPATLYAVLAAAALVLVLGAGARLLVDDRSEASAGQPSASSTAGTSSDDTSGLTLGAAELALVGDGLQVSAPLHNGEPDPVTLLTLDGLPAGLRALLPAAGLPLPPESTGTLTLGWDGPDCAQPAPERVLGDVRWTARTADGATATGALATGPVEEVLLSTWLDVCAGRPTQGGNPREDADDPIGEDVDGTS
ncbi:hypothetical protein [Motilibacter aurantiacus]|uniref:hypothetical protein n=1 Tax=Motilibacter aurantiacus TaxID=2714955 RepID=UPI00140A17DD|nr:hypothetical protein [Motilibacter aurantiacus]NHC44358.1 hypothetical protein [Motilibacter aurantiacus]